MPPSLTIDNRTVPVDGKGNLLLRYRGKKRTFPYFSAADVLTTRYPPARLRGKIVFVGTTALGTREVVATPLDTLFAGVEVQATVADNLLEQDFIRRSALGTSLESLVVLVARHRDGGAGGRNRHRFGADRRGRERRGALVGNRVAAVDPRRVHLAAVRRRWAFWPRSPS